MWDRDRQFRQFWEGETTKVPQYYVDAIRRDLGPLWEWLPKGAVDHDPNAYLKSEERTTQIPSTVPVVDGVQTPVRSGQ